ncbi:MAG: hypothetical protein O7G32_03890, partial [SAR324 cluster bacterium]|nr:hypothetical protein [SAR324 cluster bacterium]
PRLGSCFLRHPNQRGARAILGSVAGALPGGVMQQFARQTVLSKQCKRCAVWSKSDDYFHAEESISPWKMFNSVAIVT